MPSGALHSATMSDGPNLTVYVSSGSAERSTTGIPTPSSLIGRLEALTANMRANGTHSENVFEETDELPTPIGSSPIIARANPSSSVKPSPIFEADSPDGAQQGDGDGGDAGGGDGDGVSKGLSFVQEEVDESFLAELERQSAAELSRAASTIQARYRGNKTRAAMASYNFNRPRTKKSKLRNRRHGRDPPKFSQGGGVRRGPVHENSTRYGNANRHGVRALLGQIAPTQERSSRHFHAKHIHTHRPLTDTLPPIDTQKREETPKRHAVGRGVSGFLPRVNPDGSIASAPPAPEAGGDEEDLDSDEEEARRVAELGKGGLEPAHRFGGKAAYGTREIDCFARSLSEDFTNYCKRGGMRRVHYKPAKLNKEWRACSALFRTQVGPWAGSLNGKDQWPGARKQVRDVCLCPPHGC